MPISITEGEIAINPPDLIVSHGDVEIWEIDCISKYPGCYIEEGDYPTVYLYAAKDTLRSDSKKKGIATEISFPPLTGGRHIMVEALRYTVRICIWKDGREDRDNPVP